MNGVKKVRPRLEKPYWICVQCDTLNHCLRKKCGLCGKTKLKDNMNIVSIWLIYSFSAFIYGGILGVLNGLFSYCQCSGCYYTNELFGDLILPLSTIFVIWIISLIPTGLIVDWIEEKKLLNYDAYEKN